MKKNKIKLLEQKKKYNQRKREAKLEEQSKSEPITN